MRTFMAGTYRTRLSVASKVVLAKSLAKPCTALAIKSAVAGATTTKSAERDNSICPISASSDKENNSVNTFSPDNPPMDKGVTNS